MIGDVLNLISWLYLKTVSGRYITYSRHVIKVLMSSIVYFYQRKALVQVSTPFFMRKLTFHGVCTFPFKPCMYTELKVRRVNSWFKFSKVTEKRLKSRMKLIFWALFFMNELHLKITGFHRFFSCKIFCILFPNWIL